MRGINSWLKSGSSDVFLRKYDTAGNLQWTQYLGGNVRSSAVKLDASGNIYIVGFTTDILNGVSLTGNQDAFIVKYDPAGTLQWTKLLGASGKNTGASAVSVDSGGNAFVCGSTNGALTASPVVGTEEYFVAKYNASGVLQWTRQLGASGKTTYGNAVASDTSSNVYLLASTNGDLPPKKRTQKSTC